MYSPPPDLLLNNIQVGGTMILAASSSATVVLVPHKSSSGKGLLCRLADVTGQGQFCKGWAATSIYKLAGN
jgi:hypothetical protein